MYMVERVAKMVFSKGMKHKLLRLNPNKIPRFPSPRSDEATTHEQKIFEEQARQQDQK
jgi:hypothetical protein